MVRRSNHNSGAYRSNLEPDFLVSEIAVFTKALFSSKRLLMSAMSVFCIAEDFARSSSDCLK